MTDISDHFPVMVCVDTAPQKAKLPLKFTTRKLTETAMEHIRALLQATDWTNLETMSVDESFSTMNDTILEVLDMCAPEQQVTISAKYVYKEKWMTKGLFKSSCTNTKLYKKSIGKPKSHAACIRYVTYRNLFNKIKRIAKQQYFCNQLSMFKNDISKTWHILKTLIGKANDKTSFPDMFKVEGKNVTDATLISEGFCKYFTNVGKMFTDNIAQSKNNYKHYLQGNYTSSIFLNPTDPDEILEIIKDLKPKNSSGCDKISSKILKLISNEIAIPLSSIINKSLAEGIVPKCMKTAKVIPIFKAKDNQQFTNYRPISLLPSISKVLEKTMHKRLYNFLNSKKILYGSQYGFRKKHSTNQAITELTSKIIDAFDKKKYTIGIFLDLSKAFDTIDHSILTNKLQFYGIRGIALEWFKSYLNDRKQLVEYNGSQSELQEISCGVPQGSVLGPLLFILYTNDLPACFKHSNGILFADDTTVYYSHQDLVLAYKLITDDLEILDDWFKANKLSLNISKTNHVVFHPANRILPTIEF